MSRYQNKVDHIKNRMDATMHQLNQAKSASQYTRNYAAANEYSPLRTSNSPKRDVATYARYPHNTELPAVERKLQFNNSRSKSPKSNRKRSGSSNLRNLKVSYQHASADMNMSNARTTANNFTDLIYQIETLQRERDHYANVAHLEKQKNVELEKEFHTLRELIAQAQRPPGLEENLILKNELLREKELKIQAESELSRVR